MRMNLGYLKKMQDNARDQGIAEPTYRCHKCFDTGFTAPKFNSRGYEVVFFCPERKNIILHPGPASWEPNLLKPMRHEEEQPPNNVTGTLFG